MANIPYLPAFPGTNLNDINLDWLIKKMKELDTAFREWPHSPRIENGEWYVYDDATGDYVSTGVSATGPQGIPGPAGPQGVPGPAPQIINGNWWVFDTSTLEYVDSGYPARGPRGPQGIPGQAAQGVFDSSTVSGNVVAFEAPAELPLKQIIVNIKPLQAGTGDPSPENVRPLVGWTGCTIVNSPTTDAQDGTTLHITFPASAGTVYGGTLDVVNKKLTVNRLSVNFGDLSWNYQVSNSRFYSGNLSTTAKKPASNSELANILCDTLKTVTSEATSQLGIVGIGLSATGNLQVKDERYTTVEDFLAEYGSAQLVYELATPIVYDLSDVPEILTLYGTNNVWADCGDISVTYGAYLQSVYDNLNSKINAMLALVLENNGG